ncbi:hypothetical protein GN109_12510 [Collimonas pratensis]|uniref:HAMP domain-containing sensor histidine kinase n=1 Tax=Collimonas pratensis TaxID=279113 RepID=UPI00143D2E76|nr:ATP-binding protein [Collimonas pratensis]NKI70241.1 hypothetical protein [Collimonas pratensis]
MKSYLRYLSHPSIFRRILAGELIALLLLLLVQISYSYREFILDQGELVSNELSETTEAFARILSVSQLSDINIRQQAQHIAAIRISMSNGDLQASDFLYRVWHKDGHLLAQSAHSDVLELPTQLDKIFLLNLKGENWRAMAKKRDNEGLVVLVAQPLRFYHDIAFDMMGKALWLAVLLLLFFSILIAWSSHRGLAPLLQMSRMVAERDPGDLSALHIKSHYLELMPLLEAINSLLSRLDHAIQSEHAFFSDAAHELRTPLAAMNAQAYVLTHARDEEEKTAALRQFEQGIERANQLLRQLLTLSRLEGLLPQVSVVIICDIAVTVRDSLSRLATRAEQRGIELALEGSESALVAMDRQHAASILDNLLENALRHTPDKGSVNVSINHIERQASMWVVLSVSDSGVGVAEHERVRIFDRFYRVPGTVGMGSGLGLAIVSKLLALHGGYISVGEADCGGALFVFGLPLLSKS